MAKIRPFLFITDEASPCLTVDRTASGKAFRFDWEPEFKFSRNGREFKGAHVLRFADQETFDAQQFIILTAQTRWKIFFGVESAAGDDNANEQEIERLEAEIEALEEDKRRLTEKVLMADGAQQSLNGEIEDLQKQLKAAHELLDIATAPATEPAKDDTGAAPPAPETEPAKAEQTEGEKTPGEPAPVADEAPAAAK